jgi:acyl carrier protein
MPETKGTEARTIIARALKCSPDAIGLDASIGSLPQWDSIGHVNIVLEIETALGRTLSPEEIAGIGSVTDVARLFERQSTSA